MLRALFPAGLAVLLALPGEASYQVPPAPPTPPTGPYGVLTSTRRNTTNLNVETIRGLAFDAVQTRLYAINTHASTLVFFDTASGPNGIVQPAATFRTLNNPSALALWNAPANGGFFAIVVGGGTHGVVKQDRNTGVIKNFLPLPSEPMDVVIDTERNMAFVSCAGAFDTFDPPVPPGTQPTPRSGGVVMQIDLNSFTFSGGTPAGSGQHFIEGTRPMFLNIELGDPQTTNDNFVLVAPQLSGNNTTFSMANPVTGDAQVVSLGLVNPLPDDDLFSISSTGVVTSILKGAGTLITAHGRNPVAAGSIAGGPKEYWVCNVESHNADQHTEPLHRGRFADNRVKLAIGGDAAPMTAPTFAGDLIGLDTTTAQLPPLTLPGSTISPDKPASFPFGLAFHPITGHAFIVSSTGDTLRIVDKDHVTVRNIELPAGAIPRGVLLSPDNLILWVYAWGTNKIFGYDVGPLFIASTPNALPRATFELGADPQPAAVKRGRAIWYDADNSLDRFAQPVPVPAKVSCNTCHPRGGMDMLGWDLGGPPVDRKDTMVTQSLLSIEDTFPYHWRGERTLSDFNDAFEGLLGGSKLNAPGVPPNPAVGDLADFEAFVFSLQAPANPRENLDRVLDDSKNVVQNVVTSGAGAGVFTGSAVNGEAEFRTTPTSLVGFSTVTCAACHGAEGGTNGVITPDLVSAITENSTLDVAHLRQMNHKFFQKKIATSLGSRPRGGFGFSQDGDNADILDFLNPGLFFPLIPGRTAAQQNQLLADTSSFMVQFDQGLAPRAHRGVLLDSTSSAQSVTEVQVNMIAAANAGDIDLAAVGHFMNGGNPTAEVGLWFDTATQVFRTAEPGTGFFATFANLDSLRTSGTIRLLYVGLPPGLPQPAGVSVPTSNAFRFAVDPDADGLSNTRELAFSSPSGIPLSTTNPDTDGDGFPDGYELGFFPTIDPTKPNTLAQIQAADGIPPSMASQALDFVNGRMSKHFVSFSEPVTYTIQVLRRDPATGSFNTFGPLLSRPALRSFDTLCAHGLVPSILDQFGGGTISRNEQYQLSVKMTDLAGNVSQQLIPGTPGGSFSSRPDILLENGLAPGQPQVALVVSNLALTSRSGPKFAFSVTVDDIWKGASPAPPGGSLAGGKTVALQLLVKDATGAFVVTSGVAGLSSATRVVNNLQIQPSIAGPITYGPPTSQIPGPIILAPATSSGGTAAPSILWTVPPSVPVGSTVRLVVLGVFDEVLPQTSPPVFKPFSQLFWQLPMTPPALRSVDFIL